MVEDPTPEYVEEMLNERTYTYPGFAEFLGADEEYADRYDSLVEYALRNDTEDFPRKTRELIAIAVTAVGGYVDPCSNHIEDARRHGATEEEIRGAIHVAGIFEGATTIVTGGAALEKAEHPEIVD